MLIDMLKRHEIQVPRRAAHMWNEITEMSGVSEKTARRVAAETAVTRTDNAAERAVLRLAAVVRGFRSGR